jgi:ribosomal protein L31
MSKESKKIDNYREIEVVLSDGTSFQTKSCCKADVLKPEVDPTNHPAWRTGAGNFINTNNNRISKFERKFGSGFFEHKKDAGAN